MNTIFERTLPHNISILNDSFIVETTSRILQFRYEKKKVSDILYIVNISYGENSSVVIINTNLNFLVIFFCCVFVFFVFVCFIFFFYYMYKTRSKPRKILFGRISAANITCGFDDKPYLRQVKDKSTQITPSQITNQSTNESLSKYMYKNDIENQMIPVSRSTPLFSQIEQRPFYPKRQSYVYYDPFSQIDPVKQHGLGGFVEPKAEQTRQTVEITCHRSGLTNLPLYPEKQEYVYTPTPINQIKIEPEPEPPFHPPTYSDKNEFYDQDTQYDMSDKTELPDPDYSEKSEKTTETKSELLEKMMKANQESFPQNLPKDEELDYDVYQDALYETYPLAGEIPDQPNTAEISNENNHNYRKIYIGNKNKVVLDALRRHFSIDMDETKRNPMIYSRKSKNNKIMPIHNPIYDDVDIPDCSRQSDVLAPQNFPKNENKTSTHKNNFYLHKIFSPYTPHNTKNI